MRKGWFIALFIIVAALAVPVVAIQSGGGGWLKEKLLELHGKAGSHLHGSFSHGSVSATVTPVAASTPQDKKTDQKPEGKPALSIAGKWSVAVQSPQGDMSASMVLKQDGKKITGTFSSDHTPDTAIEGEFADGALTFSMNVDHGNGPMKMICKAKLKETGALAGTILSEIGEMNWTGERAK